MGRIACVFGVTLAVAAIALGAKEARAQDAPATAEPAPTTTSTDPTTPPATPPSPTEPAPPPLETQPVVTPADLKPWRFTGTLGVISLPRVLSLEILARMRRKEDPRWDLLGLGIGFDYLPPGLANFDKTKFTWMFVGAEGRWFPWRMLFAGARIGYQYSRADTEKFGSTLDYVTSAFVVAPKIGALYTFPSGHLTIGGDLGATIPIGASTSQSTEDAADSNARKVAKTFGMFVIPFLSLRIGYTL